MNSFSNKNKQTQEQYQMFLVIKITSELNINPYPAEFLKWNNPLSMFGTVDYHFRVNKMRT